MRAGVRATGGARREPRPSPIREFLLTARNALPTWSRRSGGSGGRARVDGADADGAASTRAKRATVEGGHHPRPAMTTAGAGAVVAGLAEVLA